jgi:hypothetical protein
LKEVRPIAATVTNALGITGAIKGITIEETDSPWGERALIKRKRDHLDVKIRVWPNDIYLYGRIYRLFLYIYDVLDPAFQYSPKQAPPEEEEVTIRERYNQIWSLYVDSRVERRGIESFFDRALRRSVFIDMEKDLSWEYSAKVFEILWNKERYTHLEIIDYAYNFRQLRESLFPGPRPAFEVDLTEAFGQNCNAQTFIDRLPSQGFRDMANELLSFIAYVCKDSFIKATYYGISVFYERRPFVEMIPTKDNLLYLTVFDVDTGRHDTRIVNEDADLRELQELIKERYKKLALQSGST